MKITDTATIRLNGFQIELLSKAIARHQADTLDGVAETVLLEDMLEAVLADTDPVDIHDFTA